MYSKKQETNLEFLEKNMVRNIPKFNQEQARRDFLVQYYAEKQKRRQKLYPIKPSFNQEQLRILFRQGIQNNYDSSKKM